MKIVGIVLAAGKGSRINSDKTGKNKVTLDLAGKPLVWWDLEAIKYICSKIVLVVGAYKESVLGFLEHYPAKEKIVVVEQKQRLGTGHAVKICLTQIKRLRPEIVVIGYGDQMMFYSEQIINQIIKYHAQNQSSLTMVTFKHPHPESCAYGRIVRDKKGQIKQIVETGAASEKQRKIAECNDSLYVADPDFLVRALPKLKKSPTKNEYLLTDLVEIAVRENSKVLPYLLPLETIGEGVNTPAELESVRHLFLQSRLSPKK